MINKNNTFFSSGINNMENCIESKAGKLLLPSPVFLSKKIPSPNFSKFENNPPVKENKFSPTIPTKYLEKYKCHIEKYNQKFKEKYNNGIKKDFSKKNLCKYCDTSFCNLELFNKHKKDYENCSVNGCCFKGCSNSIAKHVEELHTTGLYDKIKNLNTPEEIAKWREDRRKRYPTIANVLLRQKAQEERRKRGEVLENNKSRFGSKNDRRKMNSGVRNNLKRENNSAGFNQPKFKRTKITEKEEPTNQRENHAVGSNQQKSKKIKVTEKEDSSKNNANHRGDNKTCNEANDAPEISITSDEDEPVISSLPPFKGTSSISNYKKVGTSKKIQTNALSGLLGMYGESSDSEHISSESESDNETNKCLEKTCTYNTLTCSSKTDNVEEDVRENVKEIFPINNSIVKSKNNFCNLNNKIEKTPATEIEKILEHNSHEQISENNIFPNQCFSENGSNLPKEELPDSSKVMLNPEEDDDAPEEQPILRTEISELKALEIRTNKVTVNNFQDASEKKPNENRSQKSKLQSKVRQVGHLLDYSKLYKANQNTLLEKLLEPHIRHERNVLLQCVRYVVENKFFGIGQQSEK
ncbi:FMR1-interacting protein NUFIP1 [Condylostylus longicornis]|uniref:FMR1-interacting protein NUFIP1 n=1 Tax=Condylostylus longicornis TaxID=2530218 RepID=UPI00244DF68D|nr:FMR1-interacting protein NUFIP1 [Condylostylus longicornis]